MSITKPLFLEYPISRSYISTGIGACLLSYLGFLFYLIAPLIFSIMTDGFWLRSMSVAVQPNLAFVGPAGIHVRTDDPFNSFFWSSEPALGASNFIPSLYYPRPIFRDPNLKQTPASPEAHFSIDLPAYALANGSAACPIITSVEFFIAGYVTLNHPVTGRVAHAPAVLSAHTPFVTPPSGASVHFRSTIRTHSLIKPTRENDFLRNPPPALTPAEQEVQAAHAVRLVAAVLPRGGAAPAGVTDPAGLFSGARTTLRAPEFAGAANSGRRQATDVTPVPSSGGSDSTPTPSQYPIFPNPPADRWPGSYGAEYDVSGGSDALVAPAAAHSSSALSAAAAGGPGAVPFSPQAAPALGTLGSLYETVAKAARAQFSLAATPATTAVTQQVRPGVAYEAVVPAEFVDPEYAAEAAALPIEMRYACPPFELRVVADATMERVPVAPTTWAVVKFAWMQYLPLALVAYAIVIGIKRVLVTLNLVRVHLQQPPPALYTPPHPR